MELQKNKKDTSVLKPIRRIFFSIVLATVVLLIVLILFIKNNQYIAYIAIALFLVTIMLCLQRLHHYLIKPFGQLYQGFSEIGLHDYPVKSDYREDRYDMSVETEIKDMFQKINDLINLIENINVNDSFMETLYYISSTFSNFIPYNYIGIALISEDKKYIKATYGISDGTVEGMPEKIRGASWAISDTSLEHLINTGEARVINDLEQYCEGKNLKLYNKIILEAGIKSSITLPLKISGEAVGVIFFSSTGKNVYYDTHVNFLHTLANSIAISMNQNIFISNIRYSSILALAKLAEARDEDTGEHLDRISHYARVIAELLFENNIYTDELTLEFIDNIERFSPLHDIGKVGIQDEILLKPGKLTPEEFEEMKKHTTYGANVLKAAEEVIQKAGKSLFRMGIEIAESHHEKWDGSGYPYGKAGIEVPLSARIVALADVFDALTSKRPYKVAFSIEKSLEIISDGRGKHFDPVILDIFLENFDKIELLYNKFHDNKDQEYAS